MADNGSKTRAEIAAAVEKAQAEAEKARVEAEKLRAEAEEAKAKARVAQIELRKKEYDEDRRLASDEHYRVYRFRSPVSDSTVKECMSTLAVWHRTAPGCEITIIFDSPGGSVIDGMALFDYLQELRAAGHKIVTKAQGYAASMAGILLQAGDERVMSKQAWMLIHETQFGALGSYGDVKDTVTWVEKIQERILDIFATRAKETGRPKAITRGQLKRRWHRKDWWLSADEAYELGLIDTIDSALVI